MSPNFLVTALLLLALVVALASAFAARAAAEDARGIVSRVQREQFDQGQLLERHSVAMRRLEGRVSGGLRRHQEPERTPDLLDNGLPDPAKNPEGWRTAVVRQFAQKPKPKE